MKKTIEQLEKFLAHEKQRTNEYYEKLNAAMRVIDVARTCSGELEDALHDFDIKMMDLNIKDK